MNYQKMIIKSMINKPRKKLYSLIEKIYFDFKVYSNNQYLSTPKGLLYTLYSDKENLLEIGFTRNQWSLKEKMMKNNFILLDTKEGCKMELNSMKCTLKQLGLRTFNEKYYKYTNVIMRHLNTLGWPIGNSLYKQRRIRKEISSQVY